MIKMDQLEFAPITGDPGPYDRVAVTVLDGAYCTIMRCSYDALYDISVANRVVIEDISEDELRVGIPLPLLS